MQPIPPRKSKKSRAKRKMSKEDLDDQKFKDDLVARDYEARIKREADDQLVRDCGSSDWRVPRKHHLVDWLANEVVLTLVCRKCKHRRHFVTKADPTAEVHYWLAETDQEKLKRKLFTNLWQAANRLNA